MVSKEYIPLSVYSVFIKHCRLLKKNAATDPLRVETLLPVFVKFRKLFGSEKLCYVQHVH